jgi:hypothetical protein
MTPRDPRALVRSVRQHPVGHRLAPVLVPLAGLLLSALTPAVGSLTGLVALVTSNAGGIAVVGW